MIDDLKYAAHRCLRTPGFVATVTLLLGLGLGANTALFTMANALLLQPRPGVHGAEQLYFLAFDGSRSALSDRLSYREIETIRDSAGVFASVAGFSDGTFAVRGVGEPERMSGQYVTGAYFSVLRTPAQFGRMPTPDDDRPDSPLVVVISDAFWRRSYAASPAVIGRSIAINGVTATIVGVAPPHFNGADLAERERQIWIPLVASMTDARSTDGGVLRSRDRWLKVVGRLGDDVTPTRASAVMTTILTRAAARDSAVSRPVAVRLYSAATGMPARKSGALLPLTAFSIAVTLTVFLIACANVSNLLLARGINRRREIAVRLSMGASRSRVIRQLLVESAMLAALGAAAGLLFSAWSVDALVAFGRFPIPIEVKTDVTVLGVSVSLMVVAMLLVGVVPALDATRADVSAALKNSAPGLDRRRARLQSRLVVAQVALSILLLCTAALFLRGLRKDQEFAVGFDTSRHVAAISLDISQLGYDAAQRDRIVAEIQRAAATVPGVVATAYTDALPLGSVYFDDVRPATGDAADSANALTRFGSAMTVRSVIDPGYLPLMSIPIVAGRDFSPVDGRGAAGVAIVSETFAKRHWPGESPIGRIVRAASQSRTFSVIGVARDAYVGGAAFGARPAIYLPRAQVSPIGYHLIVRTMGDAATVTSTIRRRIRAIDPNLPIYSAKTMAEHRAESEGASRTSSTILAIFGAIALALASVGMYSVIAFAVGQRQHEIGVRMAVGATPGDVVRLFVRRAVRLTAVGTVIGVVLASVAGKFFVSSFVGVTPADAVSVFAALTALLPALLIASWLPARRAAIVDPVHSLRTE